MASKLARLVFVVVLIPVFIPAAAGAQQANAPESRGLTVFPPNVQLDGVAGESTERNIAVENSSTILQRVNVSVRNFKPMLEDGQAAPTEEDSSYSMVRWMSVMPTSFDLKGGERRDVKLIIRIPAVVEAGSHFGSVIFTPTVPNSASGPFRTTTEVASLILMRLPGPTNESASVKSFDARVAGDNAGPIEFTTRLSNEGSVHFNPTGQITVTDTFGREVASIPVNETRNPVLPGAIRKFDDKWEGKRLAGFYKANLKLTYASNTPGQPDKVLTAETSFRVFPSVLVGLAAAGGLAGSFLFILLFLRLWRRKKTMEQPAA